MCCCEEALLSVCWMLDIRNCNDLDKRARCDYEARRHFHHAGIIRAAAAQFGVGLFCDSCGRARLQAFPISDASSSRGGYVVQIMHQYVVYGVFSETRSLHACEGCFSVDEVCLFERRDEERSRKPGDILSREDRSSLPFGILTMCGPSGRQCPLANSPAV
jgi:hypothetical protein